MSDFWDVDPLIAQVDADLRRIEYSNQQLDRSLAETDRLLAETNRTLLNKSWVDRNCSQPKSQATRGRQLFVDTHQREIVRPVEFGSGGGLSCEGETDWAAYISLGGVPAAMILGAIIGASVGSDYPIFYGIIGAFVGPLIFLAIYVICGILYFLVSLFVDAFTS